MDRLAKAILGVSTNPYVQIVLVNVLIMVADFFLDAISIYTVFLPV